MHGVCTETLPMTFATTNAWHDVGYTQRVLSDDATNLKSGELSLFIRLGTDIKNNYYEYEIPLTLTPHITSANKYHDTGEDQYKVWPLSNRLDFALQNLVNLKKERNMERHQANSTVSFTTLYTGRDPDNEQNRMAVMGNPSLSDVRVMLIGVRNNTSSTRDGIVWVNELKVTDFDESGGWAAKANVNLGVSDIATLISECMKETPVSEELTSRLTRAVWMTMSSIILPYRQI